MLFSDIGIKIAQLPIRQQLLVMAGMVILLIISILIASYTNDKEKREM